MTASTSIVDSSVERLLVYGGGAGAAMLALELAKRGKAVDLVGPVSLLRWPALPEGGINGGHDPDTLVNDSSSCGHGLALRPALVAMAAHAPEIVTRLRRLGVPFADKRRRLAGSRVADALYVEAQTRHQITFALEMDLRRLGSDPARTAADARIAEPLVRRFERHRLVRIATDHDGRAVGCIVADRVSGELTALPAAAVALAGGGPPRMLGSPAALATERSLAAALEAGVDFVHADRVQQSPTVLCTTGDRVRLISDAIRAETGRFWASGGKSHKRSYFLERAEPEWANLVSDDVASRAVRAREKSVGGAKRASTADGASDHRLTVYLDVSHLPEAQLRAELASEIDACRAACGRDGYREALPVVARAAWCLGGPRIDLEQQRDTLDLDSPKNHATSIAALYASSEALHVYHGACRMGGNGLLAELFAAELCARAMVAYVDANEGARPSPSLEAAIESARAGLEGRPASDGPAAAASFVLVCRRLRDCLEGCLGPMRATGPDDALTELESLHEAAGALGLESAGGGVAGAERLHELDGSLRVAKAMLEAARARGQGVKR